MLSTATTCIGAMPSRLVAVALAALARQQRLEQVESTAFARNVHFRVAVRVRKHRVLGEQRRRHRWRGRMQCDVGWQVVYVANQCAPMLLVLLTQPHRGLHGHASHR
jgi:hypothetical protein